MEQYLQYLNTILTQGVDRSDRTGVGTRSIFGCEMRFDLTQGFPLLTTKRCHFKSIVVELLWMLSGSTQVKDLNTQGVRIWDEWANTSGELGPVYGAQWRKWPTPSGDVVDQIERLVQGLKQHPESRRHIVSAWNVGQLEEMALPPCHAFMQFYVANGRLSCKLTQRSADAFLGVPFNIASYALLTHLLAQQCDLKPDTLIWSGGDCHIYHNHFDQVTLQLTRTPLPLSRLELKRRPETVWAYSLNDIALVDYVAHPHIPGKVAV